MKYIPNITPARAITYTLSREISIEHPSVGLASLAQVIVIPSKLHYCGRRYAPARKLMRVYVLYFLFFPRFAELEEPLDWADLQGGSILMLCVFFCYCCFFVPMCSCMCLQVTFQGQDAPKYHICIVFLTSFHFVIELLSISKVIIFSAIATADRHPPIATPLCPRSR